jgi:subtilisin family serine protease
MKNFPVYLFLLLSTSISAQRFIVQLYKNTIIDSVNIHSFKQNTTYDIRKISEILNLYAISTNLDVQNSERYLQYLKQIPFVQYAQTDHAVSSRATPNDSLFSSQWDMSKINLQKVWEKTKGGVTIEGDTIVIGIIEPGGFDYKHQDLLPNVWKNHAEIPNNNIDDDKNGYKDDYYGLNLISQNDKHDPHPHGTSVAGIIGARGNNYKGVTGVNWNVKIMLLSEGRFESQIIEGYSYLLNQRKLYNQTNGKKGAFVVVTNASWGFRGKSEADMPLLCALYNELGEVGILNVAATDNIKTDVDKTFDIPSNCSSDYLIVVTNTDKQDKLYKEAAFGKKSVDLSAPGQGSFTITSNNGYSTFGGCSAASPHVAGAIGLLYAIPSPELIADCKKNPKQTALFLKDIILKGTVPLADLKDVTTTGGRLDVFQSYQLLLEKYNPIDKIAINKVFPNPATSSLKIEFDTNTFASHEISIFNILGQNVKTEFFMPSFLKKATYNVEVSNLTNGVYFLSLKEKGRDEKSIVKFVKF